VNWFRVDDNGEFIWPGFGENIRVFKWIVDRVSNRTQAKETPLGLIPYPEDLDSEGLDIPKDKLRKLFEVKFEEWQSELNDVKRFFNQFGERLPEEMLQECKGQ